MVLPSGGPFHRLVVLWVSWRAMSMFDKVLDGSDDEDESDEEEEELAAEALASTVRALFRHRKNSGREAGHDLRPCLHAACSPVCPCIPRPINGLPESVQGDVRMCACSCSWTGAGAQEAQVFGLLRDQQAWL